VKFEGGGDYFDQEVQCLFSQIGTNGSELAKERQELVKLHKLRLDHLRKRIETLTDFALDNTLDRETFRMKHRALLHEEAIAKQRLAAVEHQDGTATDNLRKFVERLKRPLLLL
jgi:hypothetical protein